MVSWQLVYTRRAQKDAKKLTATGLKDKATELLNVLQQNPYKSPPTFEKLIGDFKGAYSRRINFQHRLVYEICDERRVVKIISMWSHYE